MISCPSLESVFATWEYSHVASCRVGFVARADLRKLRAGLISLLYFVVPVVGWGKQLVSRK